MKINQLSGNERNLVFGLLGLILIYFSAVGIIEPFLKKARELKEKVALEEKEFIISETIIQESIAIEEDMRDLIEYLTQSAPDEAVMAKILSEISEVSNLTGVKLSDVKPRKVKNSDFYNDFSVAMTIHGGIKNIMDFVHTMQSQPLDFGIIELIFNKSPKSDTSVKCDIVFSKFLIIQDNPTRGY